MNWFISPPLGGMRTIGATAGARLPLCTICARSSMYCMQSRKRADVVGVVLHLEHDAVIGGGADRLRRADLGRGEGDEGGFALFQGADHAVEAGCFSHCRAPSRKRDGRTALHAWSTEGRIVAAGKLAELAQRSNLGEPHTADRHRNRGLGRLDYRDPHRLFEIGSVARHAGAPHHQHFGAVLVAQCVADLDHAR